MEEREEINHLRKLLQERDLEVAKLKKIVADVCQVLETVSKAASEPPFSGVLREVDTH